MPRRLAAVLLAGIILSIPASPLVAALLDPSCGMSCCKGAHKCCHRSNAAPEEAAWSQAASCPCGCAQAPATASGVEAVAPGDSNAFAPVESESPDAFAPPVFERATDVSLHQRPPPDFQKN